jgi:leader peptidase (prepilin peptidase)/N-methyltransferase
MEFLEPFRQQPALLFIAVTLLGLVVGSFLNVVALRLPARLQYQWRHQCRELLELPAEASPAPPGIVRPRSRCPKCGAGISALHNIPVLSFLLLRGHCASCGAPISWHYPVVELATAMLSVITIWRLGPGASGAWGLLALWGLIALTIIDLDHQILPDNIVLPGLWLGLTLNTVEIFTDLTSAVIGAVAGYLLLWLFYQAFRLITGKEGMGYGDFKLFAAIGAWLGWQQLPLVLILSALVGSVVGILLILLRGRDRGIPIPFGPFLAVAGWVAMLWGETLTSAYLRYSGL